MLGTEPIAASGPRLYVFVNADMRAHALEKQLETQLPGVDVTVFGRIRGLQRALNDHPEGVLARTPVLESLGLRAELQGRKGGRDKERYVLVSNHAPITPRQLRGKTLGVVDILGRKKMDSFISKILEVPAPRLKHVTHERDLLALLQFDAAAAVMTSEVWAQRFRRKSEMNLRVTPLRNEVGLPAVAFGSAHGRGVLEGKIKNAGSRFNQALGVTQWR